MGSNGNSDNLVNAIQRGVEPDSHLIIPSVAKTNIDKKKRRTTILPCRRVGHADNGKFIFKSTKVFDVKQKIYKKKKIIIIM